MRDYQPDPLDDSPNRIVNFLLVPLRGTMKRLGAGILDRLVPVARSKFQLLALMIIEQSF